MCIGSKAAAAKLCVFLAAWHFVFWTYGITSLEDAAARLTREQQRCAPHTLLSAEREERGGECADDGECDDGEFAADERAPVAAQAEAVVRAHAKEEESPSVVSGARRLRAHLLKAAAQPNIVALCCGVARRAARSRRWALFREREE